MHVGRAVDLGGRRHTATVEVWDPWPGHFDRRFEIDGSKQQSTIVAASSRPPTATLRFPGRKARRSLPLKQGARRLDIAVELGPERVDAVEPLLTPEPSFELHPGGLAVEIAVEVEEVRFDQ